ncbi:MAG: amidohydrolase family protein [Thaumarchaeota archaeon]|nr:amidohydrolase [Nitrososphaerota archaeon]MCS4539626.1 amidohydrolase family protein [Nitrososphaerota archaeon]
MIIDCHSHVWDVRRHLSRGFIRDFTSVYGKGEDALKATPDKHFDSMDGVDKVVVVAFRSRVLRVNVPNEYVSEYASKHPEKVIPFCCVDPNDEEAPSELKRCVKAMGMKGLKLGPIYQHFDPTSERAGRVFEVAQDLEIPVLIHQGTTFVRDAPLEFANPILLDKVARDYPDLRMIVAHLGHPWEDETVALIRKQPNVFSDVSGLTYRPARLYLKLLSCLEYGVMKKLVFGSDFPFGVPKLVIRDLRRVNRLAKSSGLPMIPEELIEDVIAKNAGQIFL